MALFTHTHSHTHTPLTVSQSRSRRRGRVLQSRDAFFSGRSLDRGDGGGETVTFHEDRGG